MYAFLVTQMNQLKVRSEDFFLFVGAELFLDRGKTCRLKHHLPAVVGKVTVTPLQSYITSYFLE